jgi:hypothetical protein
LVAPVVTGSGRLEVAGGSRADNAGQGRIRVDLIDRAAFALRPDPPEALSTGALMRVFFGVTPRLDIVEVAGRAIPEGTPMPVQVLLPLDASRNQTITIQGRDFTDIVPVEVVLTPERGDRMVYPTTIDMRNSNPAQTTITVQVPVNIPLRIHAWTRFP